MKTQERIMDSNGPSKFHECAYDYFFAEIYDEWYPELTDKIKGPFPVIRALLQDFLDRDAEKRVSVSVLDCACGTGNMYGAFTNEKYKVLEAEGEFDVWGTDGSAAMLCRALDNCDQKFGVPTSKLISEPVNWCDTEAYRKLKAQSGPFDFVLLNSNSFCHIPPVPEYMQVALSNFHELLKPKGRLLIDTKKYVQASTIMYPHASGIGGVAIAEVKMFNELRYVENVDDWIVRTERPSPTEKRDVHDIAGTKKKSHYHTWLHYDIDPSFSVPVCRALVVVTRYGPDVTPRTMVWPYYPLPAKILAAHMETVGFEEIEIRHARKDEPLQNYSYDFVIGRKAR
jgi:SAM-dependent methyltransferase